MIYLFLYTQITDVNDNAPQFLPSSQYSVTFAEKKPEGSVVAVLNTTDKDADGPNSLVSLFTQPLYCIIFLCNSSSITYDFYLNAALLILCYPFNKIYLIVRMSLVASTCVYFK